MKKMGLAFMKPFRKHFGFWCGMELIQRSFLLVLIIALPYHPVSHINFTYTLDTLGVGQSDIHYSSCW